MKKIFKLFIIFFKGFFKMIYYPCIIPCLFIVAVIGLIISFVYFCFANDFDTPSDVVENILEKMLLR